MIRGFQKILTAALCLLAFPAAAQFEPLKFALCKKIGADADRLRCFDQVESNAAPPIAGAPPVLSQTFAFRGITLGVMLAEFRRIPFPDQAKQPKAKALCAGDKDLGKAYPPYIDLSSDLERLKVVPCQYFVPFTSGSGLAAAAPDFGNVGGWDTKFYFTPASAPENLRSRLYMVTITPKADLYQAIIEALRTRYGPPASTSSAPTRTMLGGEFTDETVTWLATDSAIIVRKYNGTIKQSLVMFLHNEGADLVNAQVKALATENAKKL